MTCAEHSVAVRKFKAGSEIDGFERSVGLAEVNEFFGRAIDDGQSLGGNIARSLAVSDVELVLQAHGSCFYHGLQEKAARGIPR